MTKYNLLKRAAKRAFSLTEIALGLLLIGILILILLFSFGGLRQQSADSVAQANLRSALTAAKSVSAADGDRYSNAGPGARMTAAENNLTFIGTSINTDDANARRTVSISGTATVFSAAAPSNGKCWYIQDSVTAGTTYGVDSDATTCSAADIGSAGVTMRAGSFPSA